MTIASSLSRGARPPELIAWDAPAVPSEWLVALRTALHGIEPPRPPIQRVLKINRYRTTLLVDGYGDVGPVVAKVWHDPRRAARLTRIGRHPMSREMEAARELAPSGTAGAPVCLGSGRSRSVVPVWGIVLWRYVPGHDLSEPNSPLKDPAFGVPMLADFIEALARDGWHYGDLHAGNLRWNSDEQRLYIVDLASLRRRGGWSTRVWQRHAAQALGSVAEMWPSSAQREFLTRVATAALPGRDPAGFISSVQARTHAARARRIASRVKRCLKESSDFTFDSATALWIRRNETGTVPAESIKQALALRADAARDPSRLVIKNDRKTTVVRIPATKLSPPRVVKFFRPGSLAKQFAMNIGLRIGNGRHACIGARMLEVVGVPAARAIAYAAGSHEETIVFEDLAAAGGGELDRIWSRREDDGLPPEPTDLGEASRLLDLLASTPFWHKDLKTCNWWRRANGSLGLLDTDAVWWRRGALRRRLRRVLLSLHRSAPPTLSGFRRVRFALEVTRRVLGEDALPWVRAIFREESERGLHYICDDGDRRHPGQQIPWWAPPRDAAQLVASGPSSAASPNG
jgi:hypothetical protein